MWTIRRDYFDMHDLRQSHAWARYLESIGWKVEKRGGVYYFLKKIPILGYFLKVQRPEKVNFRDTNYFEKKYKPIQILIEPKTKPIREKGYKLSKNSSLPTKTLVIDLKRSYDYLLKSFSQKTRYNIKLSQRKGVGVIETDDINLFTKFWRNNFERKRFPFFSQVKNILALKKSFAKNAYTLLAKKDNKIIGGLFILIYDRVAYYMYAATDDVGRKNFAPTYLTWEAIRLAKKLDCATFDFDGIYDERFPIKTWQGFTKFKKGFGGHEVSYPGSFVKNRLGI